MILGRLAALILCACALVSYSQMIEVLVNKKRRNICFVGLAFCSAWWSTCFGIMFWQVEAEKAYTWRSIGMPGIFGYIIFMTILVAGFFDVSKILKKCGIIFSFLGILICPLTMLQESVELELAPRGMAYRLPRNFANIAYSSHTLILLILFIGVAVFAIYRENKKGKRRLFAAMLAAAIVITCGAILDIVMPMYGGLAIPGSCICQSLGTCVMYIAIRFRNKTVVNAENMSSYVYYSLNTPVYMCDEDLQLNYVNKAGYEFLNMSEEQCLSLNMKEIFHIDEGLLSQEIFQLSETECLANHIICDVEFNEIRDRYGDRLGYISIVDDLTDKIRYMEELKESKKQAEEANAAKSMFLANMSHEIRTPMHAIIGFSELALKQDISPEVRENLGHIKNSSNNLLSIINDILDFSKIESGKSEITEVPYYASALLKDAIVIISNQAKAKGLKFKVDIDDSFPRKLHGDKTRIRSVLINVLNNAVKYTEIGSVHFKVKNSYVSEDLVECIFEVSDTGIGMHQEEMEHLFQAFDRLDKKVHYGVEGSGLGLSICNSYVEMMGGRIEVESTYGEGSTFRVIIRQQVLEHKPIDMDFVHQSGGSNGKMRIRNQRILVVDDNMINRMVAEGLLNAYGGEVEMADGGQAAIDACMTKKYDLIFMDHMMPEVDGTMAQKAIRQISPHYADQAAIIVLTADAIAGMREHFLAEGFDEYLSKPLEIAKLERMFRKFVPEECIYYE